MLLSYIKHLREFCCCIYFLYSIHIGKPLDAPQSTLLILNARALWCLSNLLVWSLYAKWLWRYAPDKHFIWNYGWTKHRLGRPLGKTTLFFKIILTTFSQIHFNNTFMHPLCFAIKLCSCYFTQTQHKVSVVYKFASCHDIYLSGWMMADL